MKRPQYRSHFLPVVNVSLQDYQSAIRVEVNGRNFFTENLLHLYQSFIYQGSGGQEVSKYSVLSNTYYVRSLFNKTITGRIIP